MAKGGKRGHNFKNKSGGKRRKTATDSLSGKQKSDLRQFGEVHPADDKSNSQHKYKKVLDIPQEATKEAESSSSEESEDEVQHNPYLQLISTINTNSASQEHIVEEYEEDDEYESDDIKPEEDSEIAAPEPSKKIHGSNKGKEKTAARSERKGVSVEKECTETVHDSSGDEAPVSEINTSEDEQSIADNELEVDEEKEENTLVLKETDPFSVHFEKDIEEDVAEVRMEKQPWEREDKSNAVFGKTVTYRSPHTSREEGNFQETDLKKLHVKQSLCNQVNTANNKYGRQSQSEGSLTVFQHQLFSHLNTYQDLYYPERTPTNGEEIRLTYCLHALNHVLKTRSRVISHNAKIKSKKDDMPDDYRDQGLTRPKVLIVLPFRDAAFKVVNMLTTLLTHDGQSFVSNKKRFQKEYSIEEDTKKGLKPEDYEYNFNGNIDDHFRIGIGIAKKSLKLYTDFYSADIILASPLGLRTIIGADGEDERDFDFLSSIEMLIFDQMDVFNMQNWDHITHLLKHLHIQPKESHGVDFSRIRMWTLNGWSQVYRQTLIFSNIVSPEINAVFNKYCHNYAGKVQVLKQPTKGTICQIVTQVPQVFHKLNADSYSQLPDARFEFFKSRILPDHKDQLMFRTLVFISSYFDFVRLRNFFKKEEIDFVHISEYSKDKHVTRARGLFYHGKIHFMLYTERFHFFRRYRLRGIKHLIFYELPSYPQFYSEMCNMLSDPKKTDAKENFSCSVIYSKFDVHKLAAVVGTERAAHMVNSDKGVHMFVTGE